MMAEKYRWLQPTKRKGKKRKPHKPYSSDDVEKSITAYLESGGKITKVEITDDPGGSNPAHPFSNGFNSKSKRLNF